MNRQQATTTIFGMPRQPLAPGEHGRISVAPNPRAQGSVVIRDAWYAQTRFHDPVTGKTAQIRRFGPNEKAAERALLEALRERMEPDAPDDRFATLGEAVAAFFSGPVPEGWSEGTARSMGYARRRLDEHATEPWPVSAARAEGLFADGSRTGDLALRLLRQARQRQ